MRNKKKTLGPYSCGTFHLQIFYYTLPAVILFLVKFVFFSFNFGCKGGFFHELTNNTVFSSECKIQRTLMAKARV